MLEDQDLSIQLTDRWYRCAMAVTILVQNTSTICLSRRNGNLYAVYFVQQAVTHS